MCRLKIFLPFKVMDVEVFAFSECFLFLFISFFLKFRLLLFAMVFFIWIQKQKCNRSESFSNIFNKLNQALTKKGMFAICISCNDLSASVDIRSVNKSIFNTC